MNHHLLGTLVHERQAQLLSEAEARRLWNGIRRSRRRDGISRGAGGHGQVPDRPRLSDCDRLAGLIETDGIEAVEDQLQLLLTRSDAAGVPSVLLRIAVDPTEPAIARARAFGRICSELASDRRDSPDEQVSSAA